MNQMTSNVVAFKSAKPLSTQHPAAPGVLSRFVAWLRGYLAVRRTLRAFDQLSHDQLKDIGYRRVPDGYSKYERLP